MFSINYGMVKMAASFISFFIFCNLRHAASIVMNCLLVILPEALWQALQIFHLLVVQDQIQVTKCSRMGRVHWFLYFNIEVSRYDILVHNMYLLKLILMTSRSRATFAYDGLEVEICGSENIRFNKPSFTLNDTLFIERE